MLLSLSLILLLISCRDGEEKKKEEEEEVLELRNARREGREGPQEKKPTTQGDEDTIFFSGGKK